MKLSGLSQKEVLERTEKGKINHFHDPNDLTIQDIIAHHTFTFFNLIILILALLVISAGAYKNLLFVGAALCNMFIGIFQEVRAKKTLDRLNIIAESKLLALRDGKEVLISVHEIVLDDILHFKNGNQIVCDSILLEGALEVNESLMTGEADLVEKKVEQKLYSGTFIVSGSGYAQVTAVGKDNIANQILLKGKANTAKKSMLQENIDMILKLVSIIILPLGILIFLAQFFLSHASYSASIMGTVASVSGLIPEGLVLLTSISLALGAVSLAKQQTLVHDIYCIETLAHIDVLCLDKTGTLTENKMKVEKLYRLQDDPFDKEITMLLHTLKDENATIMALRDYFKQPTKEEKAIAVFPFSSERKYSGAVYEHGTYLLGAAQFLFPHGEDHLKEIIDRHTIEGMRVLCFAYSPSKMVNYHIPSDLLPLGLIVLSDQIRPNAKETLRYFRRQDIDIRVISGDAPETVSKIAKKVGIIDVKNYVDASTLDTPEKLKEAALSKTIFGRVTPTQKKEIIRYLQEDGHTVGMTGDGVNDVMALKQADCSIAMAHGSEAAKEVANIVLLDSDFSHLPKVLAEGRKVVHHIQNASSLFLVKTIYSFLITLITLFTFTTYPFKPIQLTFISSLAVGIPSFFLTLEKDYRIVTGVFIVNVLKKALPGAISIVMEVILVSIFCQILKYPQEIRSTMCVLTTISCAFLTLKNIYPLHTKYRRLIYNIMLVMATTAIIIFHNLFELVELDLLCFIFTLALIGLAIFTKPYHEALAVKIINIMSNHFEIFQRKTKSHES